MKTKLLVLALLFSLNSLIFGQICGTPPYINENLLQKSNSLKSSNSQYLSTSTSICVNVKYHIVRESNGTGGFNISNLNNVTNRLNEAYNEHKIYFNSLGHDFIDNSTYYNIDDNNGQSTEFDALIQINNDPNAINIYLINNAIDYAGRANGILSQALVIENYYATTQVASHEVGHCFNLLHTHETYYGIENSYNCTTAGDKVCDTPPDPGLGSSNVDFYCNYIGGNGYNPDTNNIMSYAFPYCLEHFTLGQNTRIRQAFASSPVLQQVVSNSCAIPELSGNSTVCSSNTTYTLQNGGSSVTTWQVSSNIQVLSFNSTNITVKPMSSTVIGDGFIEAVLPNETLRKNVWIGVPFTDYDINEDFTMCKDINSTSNNSFFPNIQGNDPSTIWEVQRITYNHTVTLQGNEVIVNLLYAPPYNYIAFKVRASNSCGFSEWLEYYVEVIDNCGTEIYNNYMVYPNPTSETLTLKNKKTKVKNNEETVYKLYDFGSNLISSGILSNLVTIDVSDYKKGRYILKIISQEKTEDHRIIIN